LDEAAFEKMLELLRYVDGDYNDPATFTELKRQLGDAQRPLHYFAIPPSLFEVVAENLFKSGCGTNARVVVEKPFGRDLESAKELGATLHHYFDESNIFRIDHYLGKEPVQNILYTRFGNPMFEPIWNREHIRCIQITMAESFGVEDRGKFYDEVGALLDVVQNHMLQVVANLTIDPPTGEEYDGVRDRKSELMKAIRALKPENVVRGQYEGYKKVPGVRPGSPVETFVAVKLEMGGRADLYSRGEDAAGDDYGGAGGVQAASEGDVWGTGAEYFGAYADSGESGYDDWAGSEGEDSG
jgi:glucose-6-phosphate 1-dehydrogenase